ncbi:winged helix-turn-helix domain-containing protein [Azorhizobium caulinodans]|uniref:Regulatory protein n=1 Tax=Azorhizobium caulinodans (strain ATCC 43989 / DSM 5975 / JCM 20966 / LMG 6465 / NBRC 14845 / NCIMB 13405 / ORS 571) TaxID=438753 RepID=A8I671_AZOC5|nr:winged helix-turn-helix domain-containing protein [Azorhizobium caulinodans]BAF88369.1 regulatory protein [Azorhizobium caulinodans ORS 571]
MADTSPALFIRLDFGDGRRLGPGKIALLEAIHLSGSILGAAKALGMSYRRAWMLMDELGRMFEEPVLRTFPGRRGGGSEVTPFGHRLIALYRAMERQAARATEGAGGEIMRSLAKDYQARPDAEPESQAG